MRIFTVIGNRPQFVKAAAVSDRLRAGADEVLVHTGQHYDDELSKVFFDELKLPRPDHRLGVGGGTNTSQTARMLAALEPLLAAERPDVVLVYGDTNSTLAGALAAAQMRIPVAHVEAGMRSFDRTMPEELNRVLADHLARLDRTCAGLRLPYDEDALRAEIAAILEEAGPADALLRVVLTRGGRRILTIEPMPDRPPTARVATVTYSPTRVLDGLKTLSYAGNMLAGRLARERGFDEALLVTPHGRVLEGPTWTFFWVAGGRLLTPPLEDRILASITRSYVIEECEAQERQCTLDDVAAAEEAFIASTVREAMPIAVVDDIELPAAPGPVTIESGERLARRIERELASAAA